MDRDVLSYVAGTARGGSESERVNELLKQAIMREMYRKLELEAAEFFAGPTRRSRRETKAFQSAAVRSITRDLASWPFVASLFRYLSDFTQDGAMSIG